MQNLGADSERLTTWICTQLSMGRGRGQGVRGAVQALCVLLRHEDARLSFSRHGGVGYLTKIIRMQVFHMCMHLFLSGGEGGCGVLFVCLFVDVLLRHEDARMFFSKHGGIGSLIKIISMQMLL